MRRSRWARIEPWVLTAAWVVIGICGGTLSVQLVLKLCGCGE